MGTRLQKVQQWRPSQTLVRSNKLIGYCGDREPLSTQLLKENYETFHKKPEKFNVSRIWHHTRCKYICNAERYACSHGSTDHMCTS